MNQLSVFLASRNEIFYQILLRNLHNAQHRKTFKAETKTGS